MVGAKPYPCRGRPLLPKPRRGGLFIEPHAIRFVLFFGGAARRLTELLRVTVAAPPENKKKYQPAVYKQATPLGFPPEPDKVWSHSSHGLGVQPSELWVRMSP